MMGQRHLARTGIRSAAQQSRVRYRVMRRAIGTGGQEGPLRIQEPRDRMDLRGIDRLVLGHVRHDRRDALGQHGFSGPGRADHQHVDLNLTKTAFRVAARGFLPGLSR